MQESTKRGDESYKLYRTADYQTAKSALLNYLAYLDEMSYPPDAPGYLRLDAVVSWVRLAKLEETSKAASRAA